MDGKGHFSSNDSHVQGPVGQTMIGFCLLPSLEIGHLFDLSFNPNRYWGWVES